MSDDFEHTLTIPCPTWASDEMMVALRGVRQILRDAGCTSRLVRDGDRLRFSARGSVDSVLNATDTVRKIGDMIASTDRDRKEVFKKAYDHITSPERERETGAEFLEQIMEKMGVK